MITAAGQADPGFLDATGYGVMQSGDGRIVFGFSAASYQVGGIRMTAGKAREFARTVLDVAGEEQE